MHLAVFLTLPDVPLRSGTFALEDRWLLWARMQMYPDRLELRGWSFTGGYRREIPLDQIEEADHAGRCLRLELADEEPLSILVDEANRWAGLITAQRDVEASFQ